MLTGCRMFYDSGIISLRFMFSIPGFFNWNDFVAGIEAEPHLTAFVVRESKSVKERHELITAGWARFHSSLESRHVRQLKRQPTGQATMEGLKA